MKQRILSAGVIPVHLGPGGCRFLLLRCYRYWDFPKGMVEAGEDPFDAACREVREETTLSALTFPWGLDYQETAPYGAGKVARYYIGLTASADVSLPINPQLGFAEHQEFLWLDYDAARARVAERLRPILDWGHALTQT